MRKKSVLGYLGLVVLSVVVTIIVPLVGFFSNNYSFLGGLPVRFTQFSFLGSETDYVAFIQDIIFWFVVVWVILKIIRIIIKR